MKPLTMRITTLLLFGLLFSSVTNAQTLSHHILAINGSWDLTRDPTRAHFVSENKNIQRLFISNYKLTLTRIHRKKIGFVELEFTVKVDGKLDSIEFIKHDDSINDEEAVRLLSLTDGAWRPGKIDGQKVSERMIIRYYFFDGSEESSADKNILKAKESFNKEAFVQCVAFCDQALRVNPFDTEVLKLKGTSLLKLGYKDASCTTFNLAKHYYAENIDELISMSCMGTYPQQSGEKDYFDEFGFPAEQGNSKSYRIVTSHPTEPGKFIVKEYYMNDSIKQTGTFSDEEIFTQDGFFAEFYSNGQKSEEGVYRDNLKTGKWTKWYKNGQIREESFWDASKDFDKREKIENFWDSLGNKLVSNGNGEYILDEDNDNGLKSG